VGGSKTTVFEPKSATFNKTSLGGGQNIAPAPRCIGFKCLNFLRNIYFVEKFKDALSARPHTETMKI